MDPKDRLQLTKMVKAYESEETTDKIRSLRHSQLIRNDVGVLQQLKHKYSRIYKANISQFKQIASSRANFLFTNYTNIFYRVINGELNLEVLWQFLEVLKKIEDGELDQHDGSYQVGMLLKKLYIDSALQKERDEKHSRKKDTHKKATHKMSWCEYKKLNME